MVDLQDPASVNVLLKKLWCHGQFIAPIQGISYAAWALSDTEVSTAFKVVLWLAAVKFPIWGYVSWTALNRRYGPKRSYLYLIIFGMLIVAIDLLIIVMAVNSGELEKPWTLLAFVATCLHAIETTAFSGAVHCFRWVLHRDQDTSGFLEGVEDRAVKYVRVPASDRT